MFIFQYILPLIIVTTSNCKICVALNKLPSITTYRFRIQKNNFSEPSTHIIKFKSKPENSKMPQIDQGSTLPNVTIEEAEPLNQAENNLPIRDRDRFVRSRQLLKVVCLSFAFCWLPLLVFNLTLDFSDPNEFQDNSLPTLFLISHLIATSSCIINPIIYGFFNSNFKEEIFNIFCCFNRC